MAKKNEDGKFCPTLNKKCIGAACANFIHVRGTHPQDGRDLDEWGCAVPWTAILLIHVAKEVHSGAAATESFRNVMAEATAHSHRLMALAFDQTPKNLHLNGG